MSRRKQGVWPYVPLVVTAAVVLLPVIFVMISSLMGAAEAKEAYFSALTGRSGRVEIRLVPARVTLENYREILLLTPNYLNKFWNSIFIASAIVAGQVVIASMGGYALAKFRFPGKNVLFFFTVILMLMPNQVTLVPHYLVLNYLGLLDTYGALILPGIFAPYGVFLLSQFFSSMPQDTLDAAKIDGAGQFRAFLSIVLPANRAGIFSLCILSFIDNWNMVEQPLVFLKDGAKYPLSIFLAQISLNNLHISFACGVLAIMPVLLLFLWMKDELIRGVEFSSLK